MSQHPAPSAIPSRPSGRLRTGLAAQLPRALLLAHCLAPLPLLAQPADAIGRLVLVEGAVYAVSPAGERRPLRRGAHVREGETLVTGTASFAQVRLLDGALMSFAEETELHFAEFRYDGSGEGEPDSALMTLFRGGFRTMSGSIGDAEDDDYRVDTPYASIGIRGTTHAAMLDPVS